MIYCIHEYHLRILFILNVSNYDDIKVLIQCYYQYDVSINTRLVIDASSVLIQCQY